MFARPSPEYAIPIRVLAIFVVSLRAGFRVQEPQGQVYLPEPVVSL